MSPERSEADFPFAESIHSETDQATQTDKIEDEDLISVSTLPRLSLPTDLDPNEYDAVTIYEFGKKIQDTETPQPEIIETEENIVHPTKKHSNLDALLNRYQYCKEVIVPFLTYADQSFKSNELVKDTVDNFEEVYSKLNNCVQGCHVKEVSQVSYYSNPITPRVDARTSANMENTDEATPSKPPCPVREQPEQESQPESETKDKPSKPVSKRDPHKKPCKVEPTLKICHKHYETGERRNVCSPKVEKKVRKICSPKLNRQPQPETEAEEENEEKKCNPKRNNDPQQITMPHINVNEVDSITSQQTDIDKIIENHIRTVSTIKMAMNDFMDKVCVSSKEAIAMIACESVKQLEKLKKSDATIKCCDHKSSPDTAQLILDVQSAMNLNMRDEYSQALENFMATVDSTLSGFSNALSQNVENLPESLKSPSIIEKLNKQQELPHMFTPVTGSNTAHPTNVFSAIKSRIFSIFSDDGPPALTIIRKPQETTSKNSFDGSGVTGTATCTNKRRENSSTTR